MKIRRTVVSALVAASVATGLPLSASAAPESAAAGCTMSVASRVVMGKPTVLAPQNVSGSCIQPGGFATWNLEYPDGREQPHAWVATGGVSWLIRDDMPIGIYVWRPSGALDPAGNKLGQNTVSSTVKLAAAAWISSKRVGDVVTLNGTSLLYSVSTNGYFKRPAAGVFQFRERGTTTWKTLKSVRTNSIGQVTMAYRYGKARDYRFALYSTPISWDLASAITTR
jgi:hypothetical protein